MIYVLGDSHAAIYNLQGQIEGVELGPVTAYNLIEENSTTQGRTKLLQFIKEKGTEQKYVFLFGEIDCRYHICWDYSRAMRRTIKPLIEYVQPTVNRYFQFLVEMQQQSLCFAPMTIPPAGSDQITIYGWHHPTSAIIRAKVFACFNELLKIACSNYGLPCLDFYDKVVDKDGLIRDGYSKDSCHLLPFAVEFLVHELKRIGWIDGET